MNWRDAWEIHKDEAAEKAHISWMQAKISHGFADHPWKTNCRDYTHCDCVCAADDYGCGKFKDKHHTDMIPFADLPDQIKQYDYDTAIIGFEIGYEAAVVDVLVDLGTVSRSR